MFCVRSPLQEHASLDAEVMRRFDTSQPCSFRGHFWYMRISRKGIPLLLVSVTDSSDIHLPRIKNKTSKWGSLSDDRGERVAIKLHRGDGTAE